MKARGLVPRPSSFKCGRLFVAGLAVWRWCSRGTSRCLFGGGGVAAWTTDRAAQELGLFVLGHRRWGALTARRTRCASDRDHRLLGTGRVFGYERKLRAHRLADGLGRFGAMLGTDVGANICWTHIRLRLRP